MNDARDVTIEIAPAINPRSADGRLALRLDAILRRTCAIARLMTGAEQAAMNLRLSDDPRQARKYFSLSENYAAWRDFRLDPKGTGLHGMEIPPGEAVRLTQAEVLAHPLWRNFGSTADEHPPMRGWLAASVCGAGGRRYGLLQLSDKGGGRDFEEADEDKVIELAELIGDVLDWLEAGAEVTIAA